MHKRSGDKTRTLCKAHNAKINKQKSSRYTMGGGGGRGGWIISSVNYPVAEWEKMERGEGLCSYVHTFIFILLVDSYTKETA